MKMLFVLGILCLTAVAQNGIVISSDGNITQVSPDSRWASAGLKDGDRIISAFGYEISDEEDLNAIYDYYQSNQEISLTYERDGKTCETVVGTDCPDTHGSRRISSFRHGDYKTMVDVNVPESSKPRPLILLLHGIREKPWRLMNFMKQAVGDDAIVAAPFASEIKYLSVRIWRFYCNDEDEFILSLVKEMKKQHKISNVYVCGHSAGGIYTYALVHRYPSEFKGAAIFSGFVAPVRLVECAAKPFIVLLNGLKDNIAFPRIVDLTDAILKREGFDVKRISSAERGHELVVEDCKKVWEVFRNSK